MHIISGSIKWPSESQTKHLANYSWAFPGPFDHAVPVKMRHHSCFHEVPQLLLFVLAKDGRQCLKSDHITDVLAAII